MYKKNFVSIIVLAHNQLNYTKMCIESVLRNTRYPYELILVDNGSTDETRKFFIKIFNKHKNVRLILNYENYGAPKGFNQGISISRGKYILFLNNDTIVTKGWLERMVDKMSIDRKIGVVGAYSNSVKNDAGDFPLIRGFRNIKEIEKTGLFVSFRYRGEYEEVPMVTSFCMLTKREIIDEVGVFDENYGFGTNDDHDFCLRVRMRGYKIVAAKDVFVFHFYNKTLGRLNLEELDRRNREYFVWKFKERGLKYFKEVDQPYGTRGERPFRIIKKLKYFE